MRQARPFSVASAVFLTTLLLGLLWGGQVGTAASVATAGDQVPSIEAQWSDRAQDRPRFVQGEVIVRYAPGVGARGVGRARARGEVEGVRGLGLARTELARTDPGQTVAGAIRALEADPAVRYAEPNWISYIEDHDARPNDSHFHVQWGLHNFGQLVPGSEFAGTPGADIDALAGWEMARESPDVTVAVLDTGIAADHPDLEAQLVEGADFVGEGDVVDRNGHGTHVAGTIGATGDNGIGVTGVSWNTEIMPLKVCDGGGACPTTAQVAAIGHARDNGADVVNMSLGGSHFSKARYDAIKESEDVLFVVAAGNDGTDNGQKPFYPCQDDEERFVDDVLLEALPNLICVAASDHRDEVASFSNIGTEAVDLAAPGFSIASTWPTLGAPLEDDFSGEQPNWDYVELGQPAEDERWELDQGPEYFAGFAITDSRGSDYVQGTEAVVRTTGPGLDLTPWSRCDLEYWLRLDADGQGEFPDEIAALFVDVAEDPSEPEDWTTVQGLTGGDGEQWHRMVVELDELMDSEALQIRFRFFAGADSEPRSGADIDEVNVRCVGSSADSPAYVYLSGTSMATPHVAGVAALVRQAAPNLNPPEVKQAILEGVDPLQAFEGISVTGGRLNLAGALIEAGLEPPENGNGEENGEENGDPGNGDENGENGDPDSGDENGDPGDSDPGSGEESDDSDGAPDQEADSDETTVVVERVAHLRILGVRALRRGRAVIGLRSSHPGVLRAVAFTPVRRAGGRRWLPVAGGTRSAPAGGAHRLLVTPTLRARRLIARRGSLRTVIRVALRPNQGLRVGAVTGPVRLRWR